MSDKTYIPQRETFSGSQIGTALTTLADTIENRRTQGEESYVYRLLNGEDDVLLKKIMEEAGEVALAAKDGEVNHLRYEAADAIFHILVLLEKEGISLDELAAELNERMTDHERPEGAIRLCEGFVDRGK